MYKGLINCHLEIAVSVWASHYEYLIEFSEGVQRRAAEMLPGLKGKYLSYLLWGVEEWDPIWDL